MLQGGRNFILACRARRIKRQQAMASWFVDERASSVGMGPDNIGDVLRGFDGIGHRSCSPTMTYVIGFIVNEQTIITSGLGIRNAVELSAALADCSIRFQHKPQATRVMIRIAKRLTDKAKDELTCVRISASKADALNRDHLRDLRHRPAGCVRSGTFAGER